MLKRMERAVGRGGKFRFKSDFLSIDIWFNNSSRTANPQGQAAHAWDDILNEDGIKGIRSFLSGCRLRNYEFLQVCSGPKL